MHKVVQKCKYEKFKPDYICPNSQRISDVALVCAIALFFPIGEG